LAEGDRSITATATDIAGNTSDPSTTPLVITIDKSAPAAPTTPDLDAGSDTGFDTADDFTSDNTPTFSGTAEVNATVTLISHKDGNVGTGTADGAGAWSITSGSLTETDHQITVTATDAAGNTGVASVELVVVVDRSAPVIPLKPDLADGSDSGSSSSDNNTNVQTPVFTGTAEPWATVELFSNVEGGSIGTVVDDGTGSWTVTSSLLSEGTHNITVTETDSAGNTSAVSLPLAVTIDITPPVVPGAPNMDAGSDSGLSTTDNETNIDAPLFTGTSEIGSEVMLYSDAVLNASGSAPDGSWSILSSSLAEGAHAIQVTATDVAGNTSGMSAALDIVIDQIAPAAPAAPDMLAASDTGPSDADDNTSDETPEYQGTCEAGAAVQLSSDVDGVLGTTTADGTGIWSLVSNAMTDGNHYVTLIATDVAGNASGISDSLLVTIDNQAPIQPGLPVLITADDAGASDGDDVTNVTTPTISGTAEALTYVDIYSNNTIVTRVSTDAAGAYDYTFGALADGTYTIRTVCIDNAGNLSISSENLQMIVDTQAPDLSLIEIESDNSKPYLATTGNSVTISITANEDIQDPVASIDGKAVAVAGGPTQWTISRTMDGTETQAILPFTIDYTDIAGNSGVARTATTNGSSVLFDKDAPDLTAISIASDHSNPDMARVGSEVSITFTATETIEDITVLVNGKQALVENVSGPDWSATTFMTTTDSEGVVTFAIDYEDLAGNTGAQKTSSTDATSVTLDKTLPSYNLVSIYSNNLDSTYAVAGDTVFLEFEISEDVETPAVVMNNLSPDAITGGPTAWLATKVAVSGETEGVMPFTIDISDLAGNSPATKFATSDNTSVTFDDSNPVIVSTTVNSGEYKVGDEISILIRSDASSYVGETVEVNGKTQTLINNLNNTYSINYTVIEGDNELFNATALPVNIVLKDPAGLTTAIDSITPSGGNITIDANTPLISSFVSTAENAGNLIIGDSIVFTLTPVTAEQDLVIQPAGYNGQALEWTTVDGSEYRAVYHVEEGDPEQESPLQLAQVVLSDTIGNADYFDYTAIGKHIFAEYPSVEITGTTDKCDYGQTVPITFQFTGRKPFILTYNNGTEDVGPDTIDATTYVIDAKSGTFTLVNLTDSTGNYVTEALENATITVVPRPVISTDYYNSPYSVNSEKDTLYKYVTPAENSGGLFTAAEGIAYEGGLYVFYPGNISGANLDKDLEIIYTYTDPSTGCFNKDTNTVFVSAIPVRIIGLADAYCDGAPVDTITGTLPAQHTGFFEVFDVNDDPVTGGWTQLSDDTLLIDPTVLSPGDYTLEYTAISPLGDTTSFNSVQEFNIEAIRTGLSIAGLEEAYCFDDQGQEVIVTISLEGETGDFEGETGDIGYFYPTTADDPSSVFSSVTGSHRARFDLSKAASGTEYVLEYTFTSALGCVAETIYDTILINPLPVPYFEVGDNYNFDSAFVADVDLTGNLDSDPLYTTSFEGAEIVDNGVLKPYNATKFNQYYTITYTAQNNNTGCVNTYSDTTIIYRTTAGILGFNQAASYCYDSDVVIPITCQPTITDLETNQVVGLTGNFTSDKSAVIQTGDNAANYYLSMAGVDSADIFRDTIYFDYYVNGTRYQVRKGIQIDSVGTVKITSSMVDEGEFVFGYCNSDQDALIVFNAEQNYELTGTPVFEYVGGTYGTVTTPGRSATIEPPKEVPGTYAISYTFTTASGCVASTTEAIDIYPVPKPAFTQPIKCPDLVVPVPFENLTSYTGDYGTLSWDWSMEGTVYNVENPVHTFTSNGPKEVDLTVTTIEGCTADTTIGYIVGNYATANFKWDNTCDTDDPITLTNTSIANDAQRNTGEFNWVVPNGLSLDGQNTPVASLNGFDVGEYDVKLIYKSLETLGGCTDSVTKTLVVQPYYQMDTITVPEARTYLQDFEDTRKLYTWQAQRLTEEDDLSRWMLGKPDGAVINTAASGNSSWYMKLDDKSNVENSQVVSPCFDFAGLEKPMIKMNIWASNLDRLDGAVLQYKTDYGETWTNLGDNVSEGINWFNSDNVTSQPGGEDQFFGWNDQMESWVSARYSLDSLIGERTVQFRIAYAFSGSDIEKPDGFAFDDVWIGERRQNVLTEYFTNTEVGSSASGDAFMARYEKRKREDVIPVHYHTGSPEGDVAYESYSSGPSSRVFYYGVSGVPFMYSNGIIGEPLADTAAFEFATNLELLRDPEVDIFIRDTMVRGQADITLRANTDLSGKNIVMYVAIVKDSVDIGGSTFVNLTRKFLPDPGGITLNTDAFAAGQTVTESVAINQAAFIGAGLVVFVQNSDTKEIYQVVKLGVDELKVSHQLYDVEDLVDVYPNPVNDRLFIDSYYEIDRLMLLDIGGRVIMEIRPEQERTSISVQGLKSGVYFVKGITEQGEFVKKIIKR
ncbi:MAG: T9SS type A sorting domain-containing protein, partial [Bacteroidales bacterium]|nr:T9SS type A sorting domain-containing protein [Bacteroidales bacterium]